MPDSHEEGLIDLGLVRRSARGDREAFDALVARHQASVFRLARSLIGTSDGAEDVLQQTFLSAWQAAPGFRGDSSIRTWLLTIARNAALTRRMRAAREPRDETPLEDLGIRAGWGGPDPEQLAAAAEQRDHLAAALASLVPEEREILTLRDLEGLPGDDVAAMLGLSLAAMKSRLHRARLSLAATVRGGMTRATHRA
ncbi:MAG: sigma-70 family RNA polymerase sigma factor [Vicinamibacterales bacterium]|nr:sigma-70 family RNA polymerase sigma factor [Vicinamibacterales bacterium]